MDPTSFKPFVPPVQEPIFALKSVAFEFLNILTLGVYGAAETMSQQYRIKELKLNQKDLTTQAMGLIAEWNELEGQLASLLDELRSAEDEDDNEELKNSYERLVRKKGRLEGESITANSELATSFSDVALGTILFVGQLLANIVTAGVYGVYQNYNLKNRITYLTAKNDYVQTNFENQKKAKFDNLQKIINVVEEFRVAKEENSTLNQKLDAVLEMPEGMAAIEAFEAKSDLAALQKKHDLVQKDVTALKAQKTFIENAKKDVDTELANEKRKVLNLNDRVADLGNQEYNARKERDRIKTELDNERNQKKVDLADLNVKLNAANLKADQALNLQKEIDRLNANNKLQPEAAKLHAQLGPIASKYTPAPGIKHGETKGAKHLGEIKANLTPEQIKYYEDYNERYGDKYNANAVVEASFIHAFETLIEMGEKGDKIKLNDSDETGFSAGAFAVYRYMILDLLKGASVTSGGCHGFKLSINDDIHMLPSQPERVLRFKKDFMDGKLKPEVMIAYRQHDEFTPDEDALDTRDGVDAVSAKWILEQLSDQEMGYLFTHLMDPVIENSHPDHIKMRAFMQNAKDPRVQLVSTASDLIQNMATALDIRFRTTTLARSWMKNAIEDKEPFIKNEDVIPDMKDIKDDVVVQTSGEKFVDWEMDQNVIGDKRQYDAKPRQSDFYEMLMMSQFKYRTFFENISSEMLLHPEKEGEIKKLEWDKVNIQYRHCHEMIGSDAFGNGGQRCLFSNLLAVLSTDKAQLTVDNVLKLKNAMAAYLDKLQDAKRKWALEKLKPVSAQSKDAEKLKELADLADVFENGIKKTHTCNIAAYQAWLRGDIFNQAPINISDLTPFEIQLAAYALGVKIGLLPILADHTANPKLTNPAIVDEMGRILPDGQFYGPNTKEFFLMAVSYQSTGGGTYYGLYPKLKRLDMDELGEDAYYDLLDIEKYWNGINLNTNKG